MMPHHPCTPIHVSGRGGLLAIIPTQLGFHPTDSIVIVAVNGTTRRIGPVGRLNLPNPLTTSDTADAVEALAAAIAPYADEAALVIYTDQADRIDLKTAAKPLMRLCPLLDAAIVPNTPAPVTDDLMTLTITAGRRVLSSRDELAQSVAYRPTSANASALLSFFDTVATRDAYILAALDRDDVLPELIAAAQNTPDTDSRAADLCAALAFLAYRSGDGALAQVAVSRTLTLAPQHRLAHLMLAVMAAGVPPQALHHFVQ